MPRKWSLPKTCLECSACDKVEWSTLDHSAIIDLAPERRLRIYKTGQTIFNQQQDPLGIYCVMRGLALLYSIDVYGNKTVFTIVYESSTMGWRSFFAHQPHAASCVALTECHICLVPGTKVEQMVRDNPALSRAFLRTVARDRGPREALLLRGPTLPARDRLINLLYVLKEGCTVEEDGNRVVMHLPIQRKTMADMVGIRGETLSRVIKDLEADGLAKFDGKEVVLPDCRKLENPTQRF